MIRICILYYRKYYKERIYILSMKKTQTLEAETTQSGMTVELNKVIELINNEIDELYFVRFRNQKSQEWLTENSVKIDTLKKLRSRLRSEVKE